MENKKSKAKTNKLVLASAFVIVMLAVFLCPYSEKAAGMEYLTQINIYPDINGGFRIITYNDSRYRTCRIAADGSIYDEADESIPVSAVNSCGTDMAVMSVSANTLNIIVYNFQSGRNNVVMLPKGDINGSLIGIDREQKIYLTDKRKRELRTYNIRGEMISSLDTGSTVNRIFTDGNGSVIFAVTDKGLLNITSNRYIGGTVPNEEFTFNGKYCSSGSIIYELDPDRGFIEIFRSVYTMICRTEKSIFASDGSIIYRLDESGEVMAHFDTGINIHKLIANGNNVCYMSNDDFFILDAGDMTKEIKSGSSEEPVPDYPEKITSQELRISNDRIGGITHGTTLAQLKKKINFGDYEITTINHHRSVITSGIVGSGYEIIFSGGGRELRYFTVVPGDITGEGQVNSRDYEKIADHITGNETLDGIEYEAADIDSNGEITLSDFYDVYCTA